MKGIMKQMLGNIYLISWIIMSGVILCGACSRDYLRYDVNQKDKIYLILVDSAEYKFNSLNLQDSMQAGPEIHLMGFPQDYDREIEIELIDSLTTAIKDVHYRLGNNVILKAGELMTHVPLTFYRTRDPELYKKRLSVGFRLKENDYFSLVPTGMASTFFRVILTSEQVARPVWWKEAYLGPYSEVLYKDFLNQYVSLQTTNPTIYKTITAYVGYMFSNSMNSPYVWDNYEYPMVKFVVRPLYDYYQKNPHSDVNIPTPKY